MSSSAPSLGSSPTVHSSASQPTPKKSVTPSKAAKLKLAKGKKQKASKNKIAKTTPATHPSYNSMIKKAITELKEKKGSSRPAILKYLMSHYQLGENPAKINVSLKTALKRSVVSGELKQVKGIGASGSFSLGAGVTSKTTNVKKSPKKGTLTKKPSVKKATPKKKVKSFTKKSPAAKKTKSAENPGAPPVSVPIAALKPKIAKTPKKIAVTKKPKAMKKSPMTIAKKPKSPKKASGTAKLPKTSRKATGTTKKPAKKVKETISKSAKKNAGISSAETIAA